MQAVGYLPPFNDRPTHRSRRLVEAPLHEYRIGDGSIQATPADLAAYLRVWMNRGLNRGAEPGARIVTSGDGTGGLRFVAEEHGLWLEDEGRCVRLDRRGEDVFCTPDPAFDRYTFEFERNDAGEVVEVMHGPGWFVNDRYRGPWLRCASFEWNHNAASARLARNHEGSPKRGRYRCVAP